MGKVRRVFKRDARGRFASGGSSSKYAKKRAKLAKRSASNIRRFENRGRGYRKTGSGSKLAGRLNRIERKTARLDKRHGQAYKSVTVKGKGPQKRNEPKLLTKGHIERNHVIPRYYDPIDKIYVPAHTTNKIHRAKGKGVRGRVAARKRNKALFAQARQLGGSYTYNTRGQDRRNRRAKRKKR